MLPIGNRGNQNDFTVIYSQEINTTIGQTGLPIGRSLLWVTSRDAGQMRIPGEARNSGHVTKNAVSEGQFGV